MALADYSKLGPHLSKRDRDALKWAAKKADEWFGNVTGDPAAEREHLRNMNQVREALGKLGISIVMRRG
jgi:hypothetical protein